jgi:membrane protein required for colicin V production
MTPMLFDLVIVALIVLSLAIGFMRGFCKEVFTIFGWIAAVIATIYFTPVLRPYGREMIEKTWLADIATSSVIFLVTLGVFSAISYFATKTLHASKLGIVDRSLGFGFGALRAVVLLGLGYLLFVYVFSNPENRPDFVKEARTRPFLETSAEWVQTILPIDTGLDLEDKDNPLNKIMQPGEDETPMEEPEKTIDPSKAPTELKQSLPSKTIEPKND